MHNTVGPEITWRFGQATAALSDTRVLSAEKLDPQLGCLDVQGPEDVRISQETTWYATW